MTTRRTFLKGVSALSLLAVMPPALWPISKGYTLRDSGVAEPERTYNIEEVGAQVLTPDRDLPDEWYQEILKRLRYAIDERIRQTPGAFLYTAEFEPYVETDVGFHTPGYYRHTRRFSKRCFAKNGDECPHFVATGPTEKYREINMIGLIAEPA